MLEKHLFLCGASFSHPKSNKCDEFINILLTFWASRHVKYDRNWQIEPPRRSFWSSWRSLGHRGISGDLYFQKWAPRLDGSTILETCTIKEREARQWGSVSLHVSDWRWFGACGHEAVGSRKVQEHNGTAGMRAWEHTSMMPGQQDIKIVWAKESTRA